MKYGIREICDVVLKAKAPTKIGKTTFTEGMPVLYFDSLKTSTMEGAATTVYAQGGKGNARLVAWEGERTVTFTMEDALISEMGLSVLTGAGLLEADEITDGMKVHATARYGKTDTYTCEEEVISGNNNYPIYVVELDKNDNVLVTSTATFKAGTENAPGAFEYYGKDGTSSATKFHADTKAVMFDFYVKKTSGAKQIEITADKFAGNYYLEASTLFRSADGVDHPAEFVIPNCKIQSNFTFTMASSGDPSTFTFTMDAFPDYTKFDATKKVFSVIQIIDEEAPFVDKKAEETVTPANG